jgi:hypothetical protein
MLVTLFAIVGIVVASGGEIFSAGKLNGKVGKFYGGVNSHAQITQCSACHAAPWESAAMADRCMICHVNIATQTSNAKTLHGAILRKSPALSCRNCHPEHRGVDAPLTELRGFAFPHDALGFSLSGHQLKPSKEAFTCNDCHPNGAMKFDPALCDTCHREMDSVFTQSHVLSFGASCLACHDGVDRFGSDFNHSVLAFKLNGKHADVKCTECHLNARKVADLQLAPQDCFSCHQKDDPHEGKYGKDCAVCHSADGWKPANFDHNLAAFKLEGGHAKVVCEKCHVNNVFKGTPTDCYACHQKDDQHKGQFGKDCAACHNPSKWSDVTFDHARSNFPLTGAHVNTACERCHQNGQFKGLDATCVVCHADPVKHAGKFGVDCATCHTTSAWSPAQYNKEHAFPLRHEGADGKCQTCHPNSLTTYTCYGCHEHNEARIRSKHLEEGIPDFQDCMKCHASGRKHEGRGGD